MVPAPSKPIDTPTVPCEVCRKEVAQSEAKMAEAQDYVLYFCGLDCYQQWSQEQKASPEDED